MTTMREIFADVDGKEYSSAKELFAAMSRLRVQHVKSLATGTSVDDLLEYADRQGWIVVDASARITRLKVA